MNVLVLNEQQNQLQTIDVDIIKSVTGQFEASEIVEMFKDFFYNKMILDVTALKGYDMPITYKTIADGLNPDKVIFYLKEGSDLCTSGFLSRIINYGIYNFTTNIEGVKYLVEKSNTFKDVENIVKMANTNKEPANNIQNNNQNVVEETIVENNVVESTNENHFFNTQPTTNNYQEVKTNNPIVIGFQNVTDNAGSTSLIYMLKKELSYTYGNRVIALEIDKNDFLSFNDKAMISTTTNEVNDMVDRLNKASIILIDLNNSTVENLCTTIYYLMEPSTIKLNTLMRKNRNIINGLKDKKVILNKSLLNQKEIAEFEYESGLSILYNMPPLNDRKRNAVIADFLKKIKLLNGGSEGQSQGKIFGLFRK